MCKTVTLCGFYAFYLLIPCKMPCYLLKLSQNVIMSLTFSLSLGEIKYLRINGKN